MERAILIIYTGGTIGMKTNPATGSLAPFNFNQIEEEVPELKKFGLKISTYTFDPIIDSSNIAPYQWSVLAEVVKANYDKYDGFVILHGTDTMSYTASALSFMMQNLDKPIIFTGSQIPIGVLRTDGKENLITSVEIASAHINGHPIVPEVCIYFQNNLFRANRTSKYSSDQLNAFRSYNYPALAQAGIEIVYNDKYIRQVDVFLPSFDISTKLCTDIIVLKLFPGITQSAVSTMLNIPELKGVVLETYGSGNAPENNWFINEISKTVKRGVIIVNITQCCVGTVNMETYDTGRKLLSAGVISGKDMTTEAALTKLMYLLGKNISPEQYKSYLTGPIRGEMNR